MKGWTIWITGFPGSGKSTLAHALRDRLETRGVHVQVLAVDDLRKVMTPKPTYSEEERENVYATLIFVAKLLNQNDVNTIIDATGNLRAYREKAHRILENFAIAYAKCPLEVCIARESGRRETFGAPTAIYEKGSTGRSTTVPGLNVPYEEPLDAGVIVNTDKESVTENVEKLLNLVLSSLKNK
jgi:adenylylsulfate kinase